MHTSKPFYLVIDFEANCSADQVRDHEIIEFPAVLIEAYSGKVLAEFRSFVKMLTHKNVSEFIKNLTHITESDVDSGLTWIECLLSFENWCHTQGISWQNCTVVTCGDWDLKTMLHNQLLISQSKLTEFLNDLFGCWNNVKIAYRNCMHKERQIGMDGMLLELGIPLVGHHHSGIDDSRNIAKICHMLLVKWHCDITIPNKIREVPFWYSDHRLVYTRSKRGKIERIKN